MTTRRPAPRRGLALVLAAGAIVGAVPAPVAASGPGPAPILDAVRARGSVRCGVHPGLAGFSVDAGNGARTGFDADICRAVAAAVLGDPDAVTWVPLDADARVTALADGSIDLLARNTTWTFGRDADWGVFGPVVFHDGTGLLAPAGGPVGTFADLEGRTLCVVAGTTTEEVVLRVADDTAVDVRVLPHPTLDAEIAAYLEGTCDAIASDRSQLAGIRAALPEPAAHTVLPDHLSEEPLAPIVPFGDPTWATAVRWTVLALIRAEELGLHASTIAGAAKSPDAEVRRLVGAEPGPASALGLPDDWAARMIAAVGSYADIWERNLGSETSLGLARGRNAVARDGGLLWAPPYR